MTTDHRREAERLVNSINGVSPDERSIPTGMEALGLALLAIHDLLAARLPSAPHRGGRVMSGTEALARALGAKYGVEYRRDVAERILADPAPLLAALAEAGVLREELMHGCSCGDDEVPWIQVPGEHEMADLSRYVTDWEATDD